MPYLTSRDLCPIDMGLLDFHMDFVGNGVDIDIISSAGKWQSP